MTVSTDEMLLRPSLAFRRVTVICHRKRERTPKWPLIVLPLVASGCRDATQVRLELTTDALCDDVRNTSLALSSVAELEDSLPDTTTDRCAPGTGRIGSLTVVPADADDSAFGIRVVVGLGKTADACVEDDYQGGCIVARRALRFIPHRTLHVPIKMEVICRDIPCGATQTCKNGFCVDATIADVNSCADPKGCDVGLGGAGGTTGTSIAAGGSFQGGAGATAGSDQHGGVAGRVALGGAPANVSAGAVGTGVAGAAGLPTVCGDGILNPYSGEYCDSAGSSASCNPDCWPARCGDGVINPSAGEQCDGSTAAARCTPNCRLSFCGDGYVDSGNGEECELSLGGCSDCKQDRPNQVGALSIESVRSEPATDALAFDVVVSNIGEAVPANELSFRYYYTADTADAQVIACDWADIGCGNVTLSVNALKIPCSTATHYAEGVVTATSSLAKFSVLEVEGLIRSSSGATYDFTNDYSRPPNVNGYLPTRLIALYRQGKLVWGNPPCGCGNGTLDSGEFCDHAGESAFCNADCTVASCGDGKLNATAGEVCDEGRARLTCSPECRATGLPSSASDALLLWLDATQPSSITKQLNIGTLADRSGNSNHVSQAESTKQPLWFPRAFGSLPGVYFDGVAHELSATTSINDVGRGSVFVVHRVDPVGLTATLLANGWASSGGGFALRTRPQLDGLGLSLGASDGYAAVEWSLGAKSGHGPPTPGVTYWSWDPPQFSWARGSGSEVLSATCAYSSSTAALSLGGINAAEPFRGWIGEVLLFSRAMTPDERDAILGHLRAKWGLP
jgi:hypothetical protein